MVVKCDVVRCNFNRGCTCKADSIELSINHVSDTNGTDYTEIIECSTYEDKE